MPFIKTIIQLLASRFPGVIYPALLGLSCLNGPVSMGQQIEAKQDSVASFQPPLPSPPVTQDSSGTVVPSSYPGGTREWMSYLIHTIRYPSMAMKNRISGQVVVAFDVDTKGNLKNIHALSGPAELTGEAERLLKNSRRWIPAMVNGSPVASSRTQVVSFYLNE